MVSPFMPDAEKVPAVRAALPAVEAGIYLNTGSVGPLPAETAAAMAELAAWELRTGRGHVDSFHEFLDRLDEARGAVAAVLGAEVDAVALTHGTTEGMNHAVWSIDWRPGDRAVTTRIEHAGGLGGLYALRERLGIDVAFVDVGDGGDDAATLSALDEAITPGTRLVAVSHVSYATGAVLPVAAIAELAHARGAVLAVDGAQAAGAIPVSVPDTGADFYAISGQKWLLGPEGTGALVVAPGVIAAARPSFAGWFAFEHIDSEGGAAFRADARRFEVGGLYRPGIVGFARSVSWLSMYVGLDWIHRRGTALARQAADRLAAIRGVELVTPRERMATLVTFRIAGWPADAALAELGARAFAIVRTIPELDAIRISVAFFTTAEELERFAETVELLAAHTPASIPPRRTLTMLGQDT